MTDLLQAATSTKRSKKVLKGTAVAYFRVSTDRQELSPQAQKVAVEAFCASRGITLVGEFTEVGVSGAAELQDRPQLLAAMQLVSDRRAEFLIVLRQDRLARDVTINGFIDYALAKSGAKVLPVEGGQDDSNPMAAMMKAFQVAMAANERQLIASRTKAALGQLKAQNKRVSRFAPYGYSFNEDGTLIPVESEQLVLDQIRSLANSGKGSTAIAKVLEKKGIVSRNGTSFSVQGIQAMMKKMGVR